MEYNITVFLNYKLKMSKRIFKGCQQNVISSQDDSLPDIHILY